MPSQKQHFFPTTAYFYGPNPLLPFLYRTCTLRTRIISTDQGRLLVGRHKAYRGVCTSSLKRSTTDNKPFRNSSPAPGEYVPFHPSKSATPKKSIADNRRESTLTDSEEVAYLDVSNDLNQSNEVVDIDIDESLTNIFESAIQKDNGIKQKQEGQKRKYDKVTQNKNKFLHRKHQEYIKEKVERAGTHLELWNLLENEVFSLIEILMQGNKDNATLQIEHGESIQKKRLTDKIIDYKAVNTLPPMQLLSLLQENYSFYCLVAMRRFRRDFPTSPFAMQVLPAIKRRGPISYVLGASTALYNELIFMRWKLCGDLDGMKNLLDEMRNQGVEIDDATVTICGHVAQTRVRAKSYGKLRMERYSLHAWWRMIPVEEAWDRLKYSLDECRKEVVQRKTREKQNLELLLQEEIDSGDRADSDFIAFDGRPSTTERGADVAVLREGDDSDDSDDSAPLARTHGETNTHRAAGE